MMTGAEGTDDAKQDFNASMDQLENKMKDLYLFRDLYFENHPLDEAEDKNKKLLAKMNSTIEHFDEIDERKLPGELRPKYFYLKGRVFNVTSEYDERACHFLSKSIRLSPYTVEAWNELGECYWKGQSIDMAKSTFEGALEMKRNKVSLRSISIIQRQEAASSNGKKVKELIEKSVDMAKEAVSIDLKDGVSWSVLGNAYLCKFFTISQDPATLKLCMGAYRQAMADPVAKAQPDLNYNHGVALKYNELYQEALDSLKRAAKLDPHWQVPANEVKKLLTYLSDIDKLISSKGKIKQKKLQQMIKSIDESTLGPYGEANVPQSFGNRHNIHLKKCLLGDLAVGANEGKVVAGKVFGSVRTETNVPFSFAIMDEEYGCVVVTVYNLAEGKGFLIGDSVAIPEPRLDHHTVTDENTVYDFKSIRVDNPLILVVNGKTVKQSDVASTRMKSTYQVH